MQFRLSHLLSKSAVNLASILTSEQMYIGVCDDNNVIFLNKNCHIRISLSPFFEQNCRYFYYLYIIINLPIKPIKNSIDYFIGDFNTHPQTLYPLSVACYGTEKY